MHDQRDTGDKAAVAADLTVPIAVALPLSKIVNVLPASATSTVPVMVCATWLVGPPLLGDSDHRCGGVQRKAERGGAGVAEAVGLARHDGVLSSESALGVIDQARVGVIGHGGGNGAIVNGEVHRGIGERGAAQRIVRGDVVARRRACVDGQGLGQCRTGRCCGLKTTAPLLPVLPAASVSLATMLWLPLRDSVTPVFPAAVAADGGGAQRRRAAIVEQRHRFSFAAVSTVPLMVCAAWLVVSRCCRSPPQEQWCRG